MLAVTEEDIKAISPYSNEEFRAAMTRILENDWLPGVVAQYFPERSLEEFKAFVLNLPEVSTFQREIISVAIARMLKQTSNGQTLGGFDGLSRSDGYTFISNHRDIILDPSLFTCSMFLEGFETPKICLGDNLLSQPWITDLVKMNKGITVKRNLATRELLRWSYTLSALINRSVKQNEDSVWIAQREGRTKNGIDETQSGVVKMLTLAGEGTFCERLRALRIVPVSISYEYDPCDLMKARELFLTAVHGSYQKAPGEDTLSMLKGMMGFKGRIHVQLGTPLSRLIAPAWDDLPKQEQIKVVVDTLDREIRRNFRLWPTHYIAADLVGQTNHFAAYYSEEEKTEFITRMEKRLSTINDAPAAKEIRQVFLQTYANPVNVNLALLSPDVLATFAPDASDQAPRNV